MTTKPELRGNVQLRAEMRREITRVVPRYHEWDEIAYPWDPLNQLLRDYTWSRIMWCFEFTPITQRRRKDGER